MRPAALYQSRFLAVCCIAREVSLLCAHIAETAAHPQSAASFIHATPPYRHRIGALTSCAEGRHCLGHTPSDTRPRSQAIAPDRVLTIPFGVVVARWSPKPEARVRFPQRVPIPPSLFRPGHSPLGIAP